ncbi:TetR/AcrR family transcriptional regulator [Microbacteriaceae bacterium VKM Ac-2855]|nr:TetR/AcrR family transcriptional regulator [Microbacteriaceae bacterium VKM Ac-2855]
MTGPRGPYRKSAAQRRRILDSAETTLRMRGVDAISLQALAAEAGLSSAGVLHHFGSKDALVARAVAGVVRQLREAGLIAGHLVRNPQQWVILLARVRAVAPGLGRTSSLLLLGTSAASFGDGSPSRAHLLYQRLRTRFLAELAAETDKQTAARVIALIDGSCLITGRSEELTATRVLQEGVQWAIRSRDRGGAFTKPAIRAHPGTG